MTKFGIINSLSERRMGILVASPTNRLLDTVQVSHALEALLRPCISFGGLDGLVTICQASARDGLKHSKR